MLLQQSIIITLVHYIYRYHRFCNAWIHVIYSVVSGHYSYTITLQFRNHSVSQGNKSLHIL